MFDLDWRVDAAWQRIVDDRRSRDYQAASRRLETNRSDLAALSVNASGRTRDVSWIAGIDLQSDTVSSARTEQDIATLDTVAVTSRFPNDSKIEQAAIFGNAGWGGFRSAFDQCRTTD